MNTRKKCIFQGSAVALVTPMDFDNNINFEALDIMIEFQIKNNTQALVICATTGEGSTLTIDEREKIINFTVKKVDGRIPVIVGSGSNNTKTAVEFSLISQENGADALLLITPYYNKTSQQGIIEHYNFISERVNLPIILYNNPTRTGLNIEPQTYLELSKISNIVATKEANGDFCKIIKTRRLCGDNLAIYSGNEDTTIPILSLGGLGVISAFANICPGVSQEVCKLFLENRQKDACELLFKYEPIMSAIYKDVNPIPIKKALNLLGLQVGECRLPLTKINKDIEKELSNLLSDYKISI